jgi:hypothetical protein
VVLLPPIVTSIVNCSPMSCGTCTENWPVDGGDPLTETVVPAEASTSTSVGVVGLHRFT